MQIRPYPSDDGQRVWLSRSEQDRLASHYAERPRREIAVRLGLCGLRASEIVTVARDDVRELDDSKTAYKLRVQNSKRGDRETPLPASLRDTLVTTANARGLSSGEPVVDRSEKQVRRWVRSAASEIAETTGVEAWDWVRPHDLRRTWATDCFYSLAFDGVPIAEELTMSWGGWVMTESGRRTFRENYLGPEPDHVAVDAMGRAGLRD